MQVVDGAVVEAVLGQADRLDFACVFEVLDFGHFDEGELDWRGRDVIEAVVSCGFGRDFCRRRSCRDAGEVGIDLDLLRCIPVLVCKFQRCLFESDSVVIGHKIDRDIGDRFNAEHNSRDCAGRSLRNCRRSRRHDDRRRIIIGDRVDCRQAGNAIKVAVGRSAHELDLSHLRAVRNVVIHDFNRHILRLVPVRIRERQRRRARHREFGSIRRGNRHCNIGRRLRLQADFQRGRRTAALGERCSIRIDQEARNVVIDRCELDFFRLVIEVRIARGHLHHDFRLDVAIDDIVIP